MVGKALVNSTVIPTPSGYRKVGDIKVGDYLFDRKGNPTKVLAIHPQPEKKKVYQVILKDGRTVECCEDHLWTYHDKCAVANKNGGWRTESLKEIIQRKNRGSCGMYSTKNSQTLRFSLPINEAVQYPTKEYNIPPYIMGLLLGDASFRFDSSQKAMHYSSEDNILPNKIAEIMGWKVKKNSSHNFSYTFEHTNIEEVGHKNVWVEEVLSDYPELIGTYSYTKFIPEDYLFGDVEQRMDLLRGLLDTDGNIESNKGRVSLSTTSPMIRDGFIELCRSLGFITYVVVDKRQNKYKNGEAYKIGVRSTPEIKDKLFTLPKHVAKARSYQLKIKGKRAQKNDKISIIDIVETDRYEDMTCFTVDNDEALFLANDFVVTHNTRLGIADICSYSIPMIYDLNTGKWVETGFSEPSLIISTELDFDELQTMIWAYVAGVSETHILENDYAPGEEERVDKAIEIIENSPLYIEVMFNFNIQDVSNTIKKYNREKGVEYVFFDYIHICAKLMQEIGDMSRGMKMREDMIIFLFVDELKTLCNTLQIHIDTSTQLNGTYKDTVVKDETMLRGSKAAADRIDMGIISLEPSEAELKMIEGILAKGMYATPNLVQNVYKLRRGKLSHIKIFMHKDFSTCRTKDLFVTDNSGKLIPVDVTTVKDVNRLIEENSVAMDEMPEEEQKEALSAFTF